MRMLLIVLQTVHGTNPQYLIEKITRLKVYNCIYWKEQCFGLTAETIIDKAIALKYCGGTYGGNIKPTDFLCLVLKLLQLQPEKEIVIEYIRNEDFKYLRALGVFYMRLVGKAVDVYNYLEPLYNDYRKIAYRGLSGWKLMHMDEFVDALLTEETLCDVALPHLPKRMKLEDLSLLQPRKSVLDMEIDLEDGGSDEDSGDDSMDEDIKQRLAMQLAASNVEKPAHNIASESSKAETDKKVLDDSSKSHRESKEHEAPVDGEFGGRDSVAKYESDRSRSSSSSRKRRKERHNSKRSERRDSRERSSRDKDDRDRRSRRDDSRDSRSRRHDSRDRRDRDRDRRDRRSESRDRYRSDRRDDRDARGRRDRSRDKHSRRRRDDSQERNHEDRRRRSRNHSDSDSDKSNGSDHRETKNNSRSRTDYSKSSSVPKDSRQAKEEEFYEDVVPEDKIKNSKAANEKIFDRMFKKSSKSSKGASTSDAPKAAPVYEEGSVEYWNAKREALGLKPLKV
jgi:pre-mRNA-splicing factor 38A